MAAIDGNPKTGWGVSIYGENRNLFLALRFAKEVRTKADSVITVRLRHDSEYRRATIGRCRIALSSGAHSWPEPSDPEVAGDKKDKPAHQGLPAAIVKALETPEPKRTDEQKDALLAHFQWSSPELQSLKTEAARLEAELSMLTAAIPNVVVTEATEPRETRILPRGNFLDDSGRRRRARHPPNFSASSTPAEAGHPARSRQMDRSPSNPVTARVFVNRLWREFFGIGISKVLDDLGSQGEWPTHPELLDWLASEFMQPTWNAEGTTPGDVNTSSAPLSRAMPTGSLPRSTPKLDERDPDNRLLARQSRIRVDAEVIRDIALEVSGLLVDRFGGPSVRPYQPDGYLAA